MCLLPRGLSGLLNLFSPSKLSGVDGISPILLQKGQKEIILHFVRIARGCLFIWLHTKEMEKGEDSIHPQGRGRDVTLLNLDKSA